MDIDKVFDILGKGIRKSTPHTPHEWTKFKRQAIPAFNAIKDHFAPTETIEKPVAKKSTKKKTSKKKA